MASAWPENTLPGFQAAIEAGVPVLELDILSTLDGHFVIHHDFTIPKRYVYLDGSPVTTESLVSQLTLAQIKQIDCGTHPDPAFPNQLSLFATIPTLQELFDLIAGSAVRLNIEIKRDPRSPHLTISAPEIAHKLVAQVALSGLKNRIFYSSFDPEVLFEIKKLDPRATLSLLFCPQFATPQLALDAATRLGAQIFSPDHQMLTSKNQVDQLKQQGFRLIPWTVNDPARWRQLIDMGVDGIITDFPVELLALLSNFE